jgi:hypothetical protein
VRVGPEGREARRRKGGEEEGGELGGDALLVAI